MLHETTHDPIQRTKFVVELEVLPIDPTNLTTKKSKPDHQEKLGGCDESFDGAIAITLISYGVLQ